MYENAKKLLTRLPLLRWLLLQLNGWIMERRLDYLLHIQKKIPVLIYQMGKVGSSSVYASFPIQEYPLAIHTHHLNEEGINRVIEDLQQKNIPVQRHYYFSRAVCRRVLKRNQPYKVITLVREPISRTISGFFQAFEMVVGVPYTESKHSIDDLYKIFMEYENYLSRRTWFENEFYASLGVDIYDQPFPQDAGYTHFANGKGEILLMKVELDNATKETVIADFLGVPEFKLAQANVGANKVYAETYRQFKADIVLPESYIDDVLSSRYAQHFYSPEERNAIRKKWLKPQQASVE